MEESESRVHGAAGWLDEGTEAVTAVLLSLLSPPDPSEGTGRPDEKQEQQICLEPIFILDHRLQYPHLS